MTRRRSFVQSTLVSLVLAATPIAAVHCAVAPDVDAEANGETAQALPKGPTPGDPAPGPTKPVRITCYVDRDRDGFGTTPVTVAGDVCPAGDAQISGDCNDANATIGRGTACYRDADGDGQVGTLSTYSCGACPSGTLDHVEDCNDGDANTKIRSCTTDSDKDGYASSSHVDFCVSSCGSIGWLDPDDWRNHAQDCNDGNAAIHPEQRETPSNGVDDDCNGLSDETTFIYFADSSTSSTNGLRVWYNVNDAAIIQYANGHSTIYAIAEYAALTSSGTIHTTTPLPTTVYTGGNPPFGYFDVPGLTMGTVYRLTVRFARNADGTGLFTLRGHFRNPSYVLDEDLASAPYFNATSSNASPLMEARMKVVNKAFHELHDGEIGLVKNGNRYCSGYDCNLDAGGKPLHHEWCSEFYNVVQMDQFNSVNPLTGWLDYDVTNVRGVFVSRGTWEIFQPNIIGGQQIFRAAPGDFMAEGVPTIMHSTMFVAADADGRPWNISGNAGNDRIGFGKMLDADIHTVINGFGTLTAADLNH